MFVKGKSGNPKGRIKGLPAMKARATDEQQVATIEWRSWAQRLCLDRDYRISLRERLLAGTLPPLVETRLMAYAFGEPPKAQGDHTATGMIVNLGFLNPLPVPSPVPTLELPSASQEHGIHNSLDKENGAEVPQGTTVLPSIPVRTIE